MRCLLFILTIAAAASGDSGLVRLSQLAEPWRITVMTDPTPIREGLADIAVLVQDAESGAAILDAAVTLDLRSDANGLRLSLQATRAQADNRLLYAAKFVVPASGDWTVRTTVQQGDTTAVVDWSMTVAPPLPPLASIWPWLLPAAVALVLYAANQRLRRSRGAVAL
jgi:nitroreductase